MRPEPPHDAETVADVGEFHLIHRVTTGRAQPETTILGPGDDAAVVAVPDGRVVASMDVLVEGVHFRLDWSSPEQVGRKAAAVNLADVVAMGALPSALLVGFACPADTPASVVEGIMSGLWQEAAKAGAGIVGGDMVSSATLVISITAMGDMNGLEPITRSGALVGDVVAVTGRLGWAAAGLAVLGRGFRSPVGIVNAQRTPEPPYEEGPKAAEAGATSMIDVSDGLLQDLGHIADSSGVAIDIRTELLPLHPRLLDVASALGGDARHWALTGGEDHALAATFPGPKAVPEGWTTIGTVRAGEGVTVDGRIYEKPAGWEHWRA
ncbi:thiamine-phosphate kinase [Lentzea rhizosphaerae]|uniref:Thiamine-monophosphate kinase n=1 Tax=Lentzea rhizosphaerae TaxID=2041025 RepID=A0ABV8BTE9_9PSEU